MDPVQLDGQLDRPATPPGSVRLFRRHGSRPHHGGIGIWLHLTGTTDAATLAGVRLFAAVSWPGSLVFVVGALVDPPARSWIWFVGFLLEVGAAALAGGSAWQLRAGHFAERHGLIYIIAAGEGIVAIGIVAAKRPLDSGLAITMLLAVAAAALLWWSYFDRFAETVEDSLREAGEAQGIIARDAYSLGHFPMIAGVVLFAAAAEEIVAHPGDPLEGLTRLLLALSIGLAMVAQSGVMKRIGCPVLIKRVIAAGVVGLLMVPAFETRANIVFTAVVVVLFIALVIERRRDPLTPTQT